MLRLPIAHGEGNYVADEATLDRLEADGRIVFRYVDADGRVDGRGEPERLGARTSPGSSTRPATCSA